MRDYRKYDVWLNAHALVLVVYKEIAPMFPNSELFELTSQMKTAAYSVPMSIVEGCEEILKKTSLISPISH